MRTINDFISETTSKHQHKSFTYIQYSIVTFASYITCASFCICIYNRYIHVQRHRRTLPQIDYINYQPLSTEESSLICDHRFTLAFPAARFDPRAAIFQIAHEPTRERSEYRCLDGQLCLCCCHCWHCSGSVCMSGRRWIEESQLHREVSWRSTRAICAPRPAALEDYGFPTEEQ